MKFTVDTDIKQIQLEKEISISDLQLLLTTLSAALKDINLYTIAVKAPVKEYIWQPWYVPITHTPYYVSDPNTFKVHDYIWCASDNTSSGGAASVTITNALYAEVAVPSGL